MVTQKKINRKKLRILIFSLCFIFIVFLYFLYSKHDYTIEYKINDVLVKESFNKKNNRYDFKFNYNDKEYEVLSLDKYTNKRKLVEKIEINQNADNTCLSFKTKQIKLYDVCSNNNEYKFLINEAEFKQKDNYNNIKINTLNNNIFLLWDYKEFVYLNKDKYTTIKLFNKDVYNLNLIYQTNKYLLVPNYNENYQFTKLNIINAETTKVKEVKLRYELYFDSYFLGDYKNKVYLYDSKNELEYYIDLKKNDIYKTTYKINNNGKWENTSNQKLKNNKMSFVKDKIINYVLDNNKLYVELTNNYLVTNKKVAKIIKIDELNVFYISKDTLYQFNPYDGEIPLLKYSEWEFNNNNMIFIF